MRKGKFLLLCSALTLILAACHTDITTGEEPQNPEEPMPVEVSGRIVNAYVTYYGSSIPDPTYLTNICYAFAELYVVNGEYKGFKIEGKEERFRQVVELKKMKPSLKISISFTHIVDNSDNSQGGGFSAMASTDEGRKAFASDCLAFLKEWGIDGVDIDWEFPGISWSGHACDPKIDVENHVKLLAQLRETLGPDYLISYAGYVKDKQATAGGFKYIDIEATAPYVDFVNIMTYDMDAAPNHHSALNDPSAYVDCHRAVYAYLDHKMPADKLVLGIPFYGRVSWSGTGSSISYARILGLDKNTYKIDNFDKAASVPYVTKNNSFYCGYDNPESIAIKGEWIRSLGMRGMMFWSYDLDSFDGKLRKATWRAVMK